ncbi:MAG: hypothetical protein ABFE08_13435 [Armatimonadia bacterium]
MGECPFASVVAYDRSEPDTKVGLEIEKRRDNEMVGLQVESLFDGVADFGW